MPRLEDIPPEVVADTVARAVVDAVAEGGGPDEIITRALARARTDLGLVAAAEAARRPAAPGPLVAATVIPAPAPSVRTSVASAPAGGGNGLHRAPIGSGKVAALAPTNGGRTIVTEQDILGAAGAGRAELRVPRGAILTALARDAAADAGVAIVEEA